MFGINCVAPTVNRLRMRNVARIILPPAAPSDFCSNFRFCLAVLLPGSFCIVSGTDHGGEGTEKASAVSDYPP